MSAEPSDDSTQTMSSTEPETDAEPSDEQTDRSPSTSDSGRRWWLTNDILAIFLVFSLIAGVMLGGIGLLDLQTVPDQIVLVYSLAVGIAIAWAFGADAVEAWRGGK